MGIIEQKFREESEYGKILSNIRECLYSQRRFPSILTGLCEGGRNAFLATLACEKITKSPMLIITPDEKISNRVNSSLRAMGLRSKVYPVRDPVFYDIVSSHDIEFERISTLNSMLENELDCVVTTPDAAIQYTIPMVKLQQCNLTLKRGQEYRVEDLAKFLDASGYFRCSLVDGKGQFSIRGGIVDIFPPQLEHPVRIEYFGDEIDSIFSFDIISQRRKDEIEKVSLTCAREILIDKDTRTELSSLLKKHLKKVQSELTAETIRHEIAVLDSGLEPQFLDKYISYIYPEACSLIDWFYSDTVVILVEHKSCMERLDSSEAHLIETTKELILQGAMLPKFALFSQEKSDLESFIYRNPSVFVDSFLSKSDFKLSGLFNIEARKTGSFSGNYEMVCEDVRSYLRAGDAVLILCENDVEATNLSNLLSDSDIKCGVTKNYFDLKEIPFGFVSITTLDYSGFELPKTRFACISLCDDIQLKKKMSHRKTPSKVKSSAKEKIMSYADLEVGDYIVHESHGIGKYLGIENIKTIDGTRKDHIKIQYAGTSVLFIPCEQVDMISKYIGAGADTDALKLSSFGTHEWDRTKSRVKGELKDMAKELIALYAERMRRPGIKYPKDDALQEEFESTFEYDETDAQLIASEEIKKDMERPVPMDRLLCGDVGFGKTEVALRAAFKAVSAGKQVAILAPTTILANQHYQTIITRMRSFPVQVALLSRFKTNKELEVSLRAIKRGAIDIVVGTHRLLSKDVEFKDLGLIIIDEEQRFGVAHKEKLKQIAKNVDVLTMTATPIPRTLNMAMNSIRDMSVLDEAPSDRVPVQTYVLEHDDTIIDEAIRRELRRGGQVFYLYNDIETMPRVVNRLRTVFSDKNVEFAHGQMEKDRLAEIWQDLVNGDIDILVCTTIIETGVDIPNANTLIIENADRMGLSQLHQIRGRVGRSSRRAYAYFIYRKGKSLSEVATKRLQAIRDFTEFGSGFKIALRDLEIRGAGEVLGAHQHGHMQSVGYDMYVKILNEAVLEEQGVKIPEKTDCVVKISMDAYIPQTYIESDNQRIDMYKKISSVMTEEDVDDVASELLDRYGDIPSSVETLLNIALIRSMGCRANIERIEQNRDQVIIKPKEMNIRLWAEVSASFRNRMTIVPSSQPIIRCKPAPGEPIFKFVQKVLTIYMKLLEQNV